MCGATDTCAKARRSESHSLVFPVLLYSCETWTLTGELRRRLNSFGTMSLRRILGYRWHDYISNDLVLMEAGLRQVTCIVRERQLRLYGYVARSPAEDPALQILSRRNPRGWTMPSGANTLHGCVMWSPIFAGIGAWRAWRLHGRWLDGGQRSTVARWTRQCAAPAHASMSDLT